MLQFNKPWFRQILPLLLLGILLFTTSSAVIAQQKFHITGQLAKDKKGLIRIRYFNNGKSYTDSAQVIAGKFELQGYVDEPVQADIMLNPLYGRINEEQYYSQDMRDIYIESGEIVIKSSKGIREAEISGKAQKDFEQLDKPRKMLDSSGRAMNKESQKYMAVKNDSALAVLSKKMKEMRLYVARQDSLFIVNNPHSQVAMNAFYAKMMTEPIDLQTFTPVFQSFNDKVKKSFMGKLLANRFALAQAMDVGKPAPDFTKADTLGQAFSLSSKKGSNVLLFFWARTNPNINKILADIHEHFPALEIIGISYDYTYDNWLFNLHRSHMTWTNVIDLGGVNDQMHPVSELAKAYDISPIRLPQCYLLDKQGIIMARAMKVDNQLETKIRLLLTKTN